MSSAALERHRLGREVAVVAAFNAVLLAWLLVRPGDHLLFLIVERALVVAGPGLGIAWCGRHLYDVWRGSGADHAGRRLRCLPVLIGIGLATCTLEQALASVPALGSAAVFVPFSGWDAALGGISYACLLASLLLAARPLSLAVRARVVTDGLLLVTAAYTWAWYVWFGPILLEATVPLVSKLTVGSFLLLDVVGLCCALMLVARSVEQGVVGVARLWALAMAVLVVTHVQVVDDVLHGGYVPGGPADLGLTTGVMLVGLTTPIMRRALAAWRAERPDTTVVDVRTRPESAAPIWRLVLPYALLPGVGVLVVRSAQAGGALHQGVLVGSVCLVGLVLLRQVCALLENRRLYQQVAAANARLAALAMTDPLTGLPHHGAMVATLDRELERARRIGQRCAVLFLDLDHFKRLNDQHGHLAGDAALAQVAASLRGEVRQMDALGRWGGEEFLVILPDTEAATARRIAERLRAAVGGLAVVADREVRLTCSIGLAIYPEDAADRDTLLQAADSAMYTAKDRGRDQVCASADARVPRSPQAADQLAA